MPRSTNIPRGAPDAALIHRATAYHPNQCGHGKTWAEDCPECAAVWREDSVKQLAKQAAKYGFKLVPID